MNQLMKVISSWRRYPWTWISWGQILLIAISYFTSSYISIKVATLPGFVSPLWPGAGIGLAAVLRLKIVGILGIILGNFSLQLTLHGLTFISLLTNFGNGMAAVIEAILGAYLLQQLTHYKFHLRSTKNVLFFFVFGVLISPLMGATN